MPLTRSPVRRSRAGSTRQTFSCRICPQPDDNQMVQCDECDEWFHFECVGVTNTVQDRPWSCRKCKPLEARSNSGSAKQYTIRTTSSKRHAALELRMIEEEKQLAEKRLAKALEAQAAASKAPAEIDKEYLQKKQAILEAEATEDEEEKEEGSENDQRLRTERWVKSTVGEGDLEPAFSTVNISDVKCKKPPITVPTAVFSADASKHPYLQLNGFTGLGSSHSPICATTIASSNFPPVTYSPNAIAVHDDQQTTSVQIHQRSMNAGDALKYTVPSAAAMKSYNMLNGQINVDATITSVAANWQGAQPQHRTTYYEPPTTNYVQPMNLFTQPTTSTYTQPPSTMYAHASNDHNFPTNLAPNNHLRTSIAPNIGSANTAPNNVPSMPNNFQQSSSGYRMINNSQLISRHALPKHLPEFTGLPEEWPRFISNYEQTTQTCGFSNEENLIRLQNSLKGKALEAVSCRLMLPSSVPDVIQTLRLLFGRPELIINTLLQKIRNEPSPKAEKLDSLIKFSLSVQNLCGTMEASGLMAHLYNPMLMQELTDKLPAHIKLNWAIFQQTVPAPNLSTLSQWLFQIAQAASTVTTPMPTQSYDKPDQRTTAKHKGHVLAHANSDSQRKEEPRMEDLDRRQRWKRVIDNKLCRRCLEKHHTNRCKLTSACGINGCPRRHHPLLHNDDPEMTKEETDKEKKTCNAHQTASGEGLLFRIVPVVLYGKQKSLKTFAFLDEGSSLTMMEERVAEELELEGTPETLCLKWTANNVRTEPTSKRVTLEVAGDIEGSRRYTLRDVRTVTSLDLPVQSVGNEELARKYQHLNGVPFADYCNAIPRILIGIDNWKLGLPTEIREGRWREPVAAKTRLGWTVQGFYHHQELQPVHHHMHVCECNNSDALLHAQVKEFFSTENFGVKATTAIIESVDNSRAKDLLESTTILLGDRYETGLLWKYNDFSLPDSLPMAKRRHACLEKKMLTNPTLAVNLKKQISEYLEKGYARKLTTDELQDDSPRIWYLPLFSVTNPNKPGKVRMVWDAAAKVNGISLNSMLLKGPDQLTSLPYVLYGFRKRKIAISADIREMFHQVRIRPADQHSQRFLWRDGNHGNEPEAYVMQVMTFGASCSPSSAQFVKNSNAMRFADRFPRAADAILNHHYVDDLLDSADTVEEAVKLAKDITYVHQKGGFDIRNWISNSTEVLEALQPSTLRSNKNLSISSELTTEKVLGMWWDTEIDCFTYSITCAKVNKDVLAGRRRPTKREVLRMLMSIFDPLGFLSVFLVYIKMLLQDIWRSSVDWDEPINDEQFDKWLLWINLLPEVEKIRIPRCYSFKISPEEPKETQLHVFVDASENAFAAVAYFRISTSNHVECSLIGAKTKVAPQQPMSIPRLELQAAVLGARLANSIIEGHALKVDRKIMWSDSKTVLSWLYSDARKYKQFVAFRIGELLETTNVSDWRWIPTKLNVADDATKWQQTPDFNPTSRWFVGPEFLQKTEENWPENQTAKILPNGNEELKSSMRHSIFEPPIIVNILHFDRWCRLLRSQAFLGRCARVFKAKAQKRTKPSGPLTSSEYEEAKHQLFKRAQYDCYGEEVNVLKLAGNKVDKKSKLYQLSPYLDEKGVIRMRGRIDAAKTHTDTKRPVILPRDHRITELIVTSYHTKYHHINHSTALNELRQMYVISRLRQLLKSVRSKCQQCKNRTAMPQAPEMADLPAERLAAHTRPFTFVGVDCFGPMTVALGRRTEKRWGMIFTCLTIRAIHIEVAYSISADSCILCLQNFIARRGMPSTIYSDNGTNFHGANNELQLLWKQVQSNCNHWEIEWRFNPPAAPHMGGSWERLVGSVKRILVQTMPSRNPTDELLHAYLIEAEHTVNSRPLTFVSLETTDDEALTPNHFLLGSSNGRKPPGEFTEKDLVNRKNWRKSQMLANQFWKKWISDYLPTITRRTKWFKNTPSIKEGDVVLIVDENLPRNTWPKGRVISTRTGKDGVVRSATIQTERGIYNRPVVKLAVLDVLDKA